MVYQVLARKWRPQDFSGVVGQAPIVTALRNALTENRIAQAYLFSGIRGVGKTTVARVLAKALNCDRGPAADPCNDCPTCGEITSGADLDVIEVDAATYSKVEQIRELTESLKYGPARDRYKVVVLDEIHRLSRQAFDALLKIVEEPPSHLVFIFATTEIEAVPATILSRCQEFHFRRVPSHELAAHLRVIADQEKIEVSDTALRLISRAGEGSVRDAVALVDQLATFSGGKIPDEEAERILGGLDSARYVGLLGAILSGRGDEVSGTVREVEAEGWDPRQIYGHFLAYCRDALHLALGGEIGEIDLPGEEAATLADLAKRTGYENLLRLLHQLLQSENSVRRSEFGGLALEIALLRAAELPKLTRIEELLAGGGGDLPGSLKQAAAPASSAAGTSKVSSRSQSAPKRSAPERKAAEPSRKTPTPAPVATPTTQPDATAAKDSAAKPTPAPDAADTTAPAAKPTTQPAAKAATPPAARPTGPPEDTAPAATSTAPPRGTASTPPVAQPTPAPDATPDRARPAANPMPQEPAGNRPQAAITDSPPMVPADEPVAELRQPPSPPAEEARPVAAGGNRRVEEFLDHVGRERQSLAAHLGGSEGLSFDDDELLIFAPPGDPWIESALSRERNRGILDESLAAVFGPDAKWRLVRGSGRAKPESAPLADDSPPSAAAEHPVVQTVLDVFGGTLQADDSPTPGPKD